MKKTLYCQIHGKLEPCTKCAAYPPEIAEPISRETIDMLISELDPQIVKDLPNVPKFDRRRMKSPEQVEADRRFGQPHYGHHDESGGSA